MNFNKRTPQLSASIATTVLIAVLAGCQLTAPSGSASGTRDVSLGGGTNPTVIGQANGAAAATAQVPTRAQVLASAKAMQFTAAAGGNYVSADGNLTATIPPGALSQNATVKIAPADTSTMPSNNMQVPGIAFALDLGGATVQPGQAITVTAKADPRFVQAMKANDPNFTPAAYNLTQDASGNWLITMQVKGPATAGPVQAKSSTSGGWSMVEVGPNIEMVPTSQTGSTASQYRHVLQVAPSASPAPTTAPTATPTPAPTPTPIPMMQTSWTASGQVNSYPARPLSAANAYPIKTYVPFWTDVKVPMVRDSNGLYDASATVSSFNNTWSEFFQCLGLRHANCGQTQIDAILGEVALYNNIVASGRDPSINPSNGQTDMTLINDVNAYTQDNAPNCDTSGAIDVKAAVQYKSDPDSGLNTKAIGNATVYFDFGSAGQVLTTSSNANGSADEQVQPSLILTNLYAVAPDGFTSVNPNWIGTITAASNAVHTLNVNKWDPRVTLTMTGDQTWMAAGDTWTVKYTVDGGATQTATLRSTSAMSGLGDSGAASLSAAASNLNFYANVGSNGAHSIKITSLTCSDPAYGPSGGNLPAAKSGSYAWPPQSVTFSATVVNANSAK